MSSTPSQRYASSCFGAADSAPLATHNRTRSHGRMAGILGQPAAPRNGSARTIRPVNAPRLDFEPTAFTTALLARLAILQRPYAPTPWLANRHLQLLWLLLAEAVSPPKRYERTQLLRMADGGTTALDWVGLDATPTLPTLVVLPSITGDAQSVRALVRYMRRTTGWRIVVCTRRGHGALELTAPEFNTMGSTADLREQLAHIRAGVPDAPLYAIGVSAGSGLLARYL